MKTILFVVAFAALALATAPVIDVPTRLCTQDDCEAVSKVPFTCTSNCPDNRQNAANVNGGFLPCDTKFALPAVNSNSDVCGSGGRHSVWFGDPLNIVLGCREWVFEESNLVSSGIFNEFDDDNDGTFDRAEMSGKLIPLGCNKNLSLTMFMFFVRTNKPAYVKNELSCKQNNLPAFFANSWYFYDLDPAKKSWFVGGGELEGLFLPIGLSMGMKFQVGEGASMKNSKYGGTAWIDIGPPPYVYDDAVWGNKIKIENRGQDCKARHHGDINVNFQCNCKCPDNPPPSVCQNGIVEAGEECDGGPCCSTNCTLLSTNTVCRPSQGECDVEETCDGVSGQCPPDVYQPNTVPCNEEIGICEVFVPVNCPGDGPTCQNLPTILDIHSTPIFFENFNAISFNNFIANTGDVEGRLIARNNIQLGAGYSVGFLTKNVGVNGQFTPFGLIAGHDLSWGSGALYPDGSGLPIPDQLPEDMFVGNSFENVPGYLQALVTSGPCGAPGCLNPYFDQAVTFYTLLQNTFAALTPNTNSFVEFQGLDITCDDITATRYVLNVDGATISSVTWYTTHNCNLGAVWIINVLGSGDVRFSGDHLPTVAEKTVWNIVGTGRDVEVVTEVRGNMLAPHNNLIQTGGVIKGKVVFGNVDFSLQINLPDCFTYILVRVNDFLAEGCEAGDLCVNLVSGGVLAVGDEIAFAQNPNLKYVITSKQQNPDGSIQICFTEPIQISAIINSRIFADINANNLAPGRTDAALPATGSASSIVASFGLLAVALIALLF